MSTSPQTTFFNVEPDFRAEALRRFPFSGARGSVRGDGRFALVSRCSKPWKVLLFQTAADRDARLELWRTQSCQNGEYCYSDHEAVDLEL